MTPTLNGHDIGDRHRYLAAAWPDKTLGMATIRAQGGPWSCPGGHASLLVYRCSVCGKEL